MKKPRRQPQLGGPFVRLRNALTTRYLAKTVSVSRDNLTYHFQPPLLVIIKMTIFAVLAVGFYLLFTVLGAWIQKGFEFFRLHEIYNFDFPKKSFFYSVAEIIMLLIIGYYGIFFLLRQVQALFSTLVLSRSENKIFYIKNTLIWKDFYLFQVAEIDHIVLKQNIIGRLFGIGTVVLAKKNGEGVRVASIRDAPGVVREFSTLKNRVE